MLYINKYLIPSNLQAPSKLHISNTVLGTGNPVGGDSDGVCFIQVRNERGGEMRPVQRRGMEASSCRNPFNGTGQTAGSTVLAPNSAHSKTKPRNRISQPQGFLFLGGCSTAALRRITPHSNTRPPSHRSPRHRGHVPGSYRRARKV